MATMKAVQIDAFGDIDVLQYKEVERPEPQAGEVLVRVRAAGVNLVDAASRRFPLPITTAKKDLPYILGWDIAGDVVALGPEVTQFAVGDAVYGMPRFPDEAKAYSEYTTAPVADIALKPRTLTYQEAAGVPLAALTAWQSIFDIAHLQAGQTIFISGGSGGVGHFAIQLAKWKGAKVITTTSTRNVEFVRALGADVVIDYTQRAFQNVVKDVDMVLDTIGEDVLKHSFEVVKHGNIIVSLPGHKGVGQLGAELAPCYGIQFVLAMVHPSGEQMAEMAQLFDAGQLKVYLDGVFPLQDAGQAHKLSENGHVRGKLVLTVE
ncbi:NADPH:quinone reductase [Reticulibacter mediterranei]|uniref:NADPH:quinone reductase n=1 Tax=Reticulibacter mediterranei TaxID=2778369 RepID=A0A8J3ITZ7_9CHLR|nr:NADP-dependent oxidoreductase [Reticulibacter mediterranei]GHO96166.1 NADPH:quinone reductase [Reticulibacter mediterranei]